MKAISLWQPWASAIAAGSKKYETRSWPFPRSLAGQFVAVHASRRWEREERDWAETLRFNGINLGFEDKPPLGCVVAVAVLAQAIPTESIYGPDYAPVMGEEGCQEYLLGNWSPGRFGWQLDDVFPLDVPVPCVGHQGFFNLEPEVVSNINEQALARAHRMFF